jgi:hypothetical protein
MPATVEQRELPAEKVEGGKLVRLDTYTQVFVADEPEPEPQPKKRKRRSK